MTRRGAFSRGLLLAAVAAATTLAALTAWRGFLVSPMDYLGPLLVVAAVVALSGTALRALRVPGPLTVVVQVALAGAVVCQELGGGFLPVGATWATAVDSASAAVTSARTYVAPIGGDAPPVAPLLLLGGTVFLLLVDILACTLRRVALAGLALLAIYSVPAGLSEGGPGVVSFLGAAVGFLTLLHLDTREQLVRWGRPLGPDQHNPWTGTSPLVEAARAGAGRIGVAATAVALVVPPFVPVLDIDLFGFGPGSGDDGITIRKPVADLRQDLERGEDVPLVRVRTDDPDPDYLRVGVLNRFTGTEWSSGDRDVSTEDRAEGALPAPAGLSPDVPAARYDYDLEVTDELDSTWLPTQFPSASVDAEGDWRFDEDTMDFLASEDDLDTAGLRYSLTSLEPDYGVDGQFFGNSSDTDVDDEVLYIPGGLPSIVRSQAQQVTADARNDYERALLLQSWFRRDGGFEYDIDAAPQGIGGGTFDTFLTEGPGGRVGYCEQFASAMAIMARIVGIPARVSVGFLAPTPIGESYYEYSSHDLHAWPELYFEGAGWVRFEPTPSERVRSVPGYARVDVADPDDPTEEPSTADVPSRQPSDLPTRPGTTETVAPEPEAAGDAAGADDGGLGTLLVWVGSTLLVLALLAGLGAVPRTWRSRVRQRRLHGTPDDLWEELRATAIDLGLRWPDGRSPRQVGTGLVDRLGNPDDPTRTARPATGPEVAGSSVAALERVVSAVERHRYARGAGASTPAGAADDAGACIDALEAGVTPQVRRRAAWWPRSLMRR